MVIIKATQPYICSGINELFEGLTNKVLRLSCMIDSQIRINLINFQIERELHEAVTIIFLLNEVNKRRQSLSIFTIISL